MLVIIGIVVFLIAVVIVLLLWMRLDNRFYNYLDIYPELEILKRNNNVIFEEIAKTEVKNWEEWPEKELYEDNKWKMIPFIGFGVRVQKNCDKYPETMKIIDSIPGVKTALFSRLSPNTKLTPHRGWKELSNYTLRCHYGVKVPEKCKICVEGECRPVLNNEIVIFDDSKTHWAENNSDEDRIILIIDIPRPYYVKPGNSDVEQTGELKELIKKYM